MTSTTVSWFNASADIQALLMAAADCWEDTARSQQYVEEAIAQGINNPDVLIAAYRYFFYKSNSEMALWAAQKTMDHIRQLESLPGDWDKLQPILQARKSDLMVRIYLHAYAASSLLLAKIGDVEGALAIATRIKAIDDQREFSGDLLHQILTTPLDDEDDD
ncbi:MAG: hypothetical protein VKJ64_07910 [Leptolyngbyaceae bacterium]|nr:hypothetical protein [Leptolyngbyaceae bacterium]